MSGASRPRRARSDAHEETPYGFVSFEDVHKIYQMGEVAIPAADGVTFSLERGELVVIVGPSGAGKTTVLNMLGGMDTCTSGTIRLEDRTLSFLRESRSG